jgi:hypothetical protein
LNRFYYFAILLYGRAEKICDAMAAGDFLGQCGVMLLNNHEQHHQSQHQLPKLKLRVEIPVELGISWP